jgi:PAS domain S-box-containing protein
MSPIGHSPPRIVYLEDDTRAFELIEALVQADGLDCRMQHVDGPEDYRRALSPEAPDLILADFNLPGIDGLSALAIKEELCPQAPFIFVSGSIGEDVAINSLRNGASDFILKDNITRLPAAIRRAMKEAQEHRERMQAESRLRESEERFRRLSENAPDVIFRYALHPSQHYEYISPAIERMSGYSPQEFYADPMLGRKIVHPEDQGILTEILSGLPNPRGSVEIRWTARDGHIVVTEHRINSISDESGRVVAIEGIARDITEAKQQIENRRQLEAQLFQAQKLETIGTLAGGIAHDFNNILTGILGYTELAANSLPEKHPVIEDLEEVRKAGLRAKDLVAQILTFSRKKESKSSPIDLSKAVEEALRLARASTPSTIEIVKEFSAGIVRADTTQIHQIVLNLATNAVHAMKGRPGRLTVVIKPVRYETVPATQIGILEPGCSYLCLSVGDTGKGMDDDTMQHIFDPFFTTKSAGEGTGLGLSLVQNIVLGYGGAISLRSRLGEGTTFSLYIPVCDETERSSGPVVAVRPGRGENIAIIDDESSISAFVAVRLEQLTYRVSVFNDPRVALETISANPRRFHAIITDYTMPHLTGDELIRALRKAGIEAPVVITSGDANANQLANIPALGRVSVLPKPFTGDEIAQALQASLSGR